MRVPWSHIKHLLAWPFILLIFFFWWRSIRELALAESLAQVRGNEGWLGVALLGAWLYLLGQAEVWRRILSALARPIPLLQGQRAWMLSNLGRYLPGAIWHFVGRVQLLRASGISRTEGTLGVMLEQGLQLLAALLLVALSLPFWPSESPVHSQRWLVGLLPVGLVALHPRLFFPPLNWLLARLGRPTLPPTLRYPQLLAYLLGYVGVHLANGLALGAAALALRAPLGYLPAIIGGALVAWTLGFLSPLTPGGLGVREATLGLLLAPLIGAERAALGAILWRASNLITEVLSALLLEALWRSAPLR